VARSTGVCAGSGRAFVPGERVVAVLVEGTNTQPGNLLARVDFSVEAWNEGARPSGPVFGVWRTAFTPGEVKKKSLLSDEELLDLFEELGAATEAKQIGFRYLLTLLLVRRRLVRVMQTVRPKDGQPGKMLVLRKGQDAATSTPMEVIDPNMDEAAITEAMEQLSQVVPNEDPGAP